MTKHKHHQAKPAEPAAPPEGPTAPDQGETASPRQDEPAAAPTPDPQAEALANAQAERDDLLDRLQRVSAEYLNYQKRVQRELADHREYANASLIKDLLAALDDMERGLAAASATTGDSDPLSAGMRLAYRKLMDILARQGLTRIQAEGQPFDPDLHEALLQEPSAQHSQPTVLRELRAGYLLKGRPLRPAQVVVSAPDARQ